MKKTIFVSIIFVIVAVFALADTTFQLFEVPTAYSVGVNHGDLRVWTNFNNIKFKGVLSPVQNLDLGLFILGTKEALYPDASVKWNFMQETKDTPAAAIGVGTDAIYAVMSKNFNPRGLKGHLGLGAGDLAIVFAGIDYDIPVGQGVPKVKLIAEINNSFSFGAVAAMTPAVDMSIFVKDFNKLNLGASFKFRY